MINLSIYSIIFCPDMVLGPAMQTTSAKIGDAHPVGIGQGYEW
jgi:hypothetical protein